MHAFTVIIEKCPETDLYVGYIPDFTGVHSQADSLDELQKNLQEVIKMLSEDNESILAIC